MVVARIRANGLSIQTDRWGKARGESLSRGFRQQPKGRDHLVAYPLAPAITDFILDGNRECCNIERKQTLTLLYSEWSTEIKPWRQNSTHRPLIVSNPIDKKGSEFMRRKIWWEAPSMPPAAYNPCLLFEQETPRMIGKTWFLEQEIPVGGFVRIQDSSQVWQEQVHETRIIKMAVSED